MAERAGIESGKPLAAAGAAQGGLQLVVDQSAAALGQDRWAAGKACAVPLAPAGRESCDPAAICGDTGQDRGAAGTGGVAVVGDDLQIGRAIGG